MAALATLPSVALASVVSYLSKTDIENLARSNIHVRVKLGHLHEFSVVAESIRNDVDWQLFCQLMNNMRPHALKTVILTVAYVGSNGLNKIFPSVQEFQITVCRQPDVATAVPSLLRQVQFSFPNVTDLTFSVIPEYIPVPRCAALGGWDLEMLTLYNCCGFRLQAWFLQSLLGRSTHLHTFELYGRVPCFDDEAEEFFFATHGKNMKKWVQDGSGNVNVREISRRCPNLKILNIRQDCLDELPLGPSVETVDCVVRFFNAIIHKVEQFFLARFQKFASTDHIIRHEGDDLDAAFTCSICRKEMTHDKVVDHCHVCGNFRGVAHSQCNLNFRLRREVPVIFHNLRRYDGHILMQKIGDIAVQNNYKIQCVPRGIEDYLTFTLECKNYRIRFLDSCLFLNASLESLVANLAGDGIGKFPTVTQFFTHDHDHLLRKGIYPYEYMNHSSKFAETSLPVKECFFSKLAGDGISDQDYEHAKSVWSKFSIRNLGEYHDFYVKLDTCLLSDVFQNFRWFCLEQYMLDPCQFITLPSFGWSACLLMTGVELDLITDQNMYEMIEKGMRGGVAMISQRYARANNPQLDGFDPNKPESYIFYVDANNLYGWAMIQKLPVSQFEWMDEAEIANFDPFSDTELEEGNILEVDLVYPCNLHENHNCYPLAPEKLKVEYSSLSPYSQRLRETLEIQGANTEKLTPNLYDKEHYVVHHKNLKQYLQLGMILRKVHRGIKFKQSAWLKPYIQFNTDKRKQAKNDFEKDLFKLLNNCIFGKSCENVRNYMDLKLLATPEEYVKQVSRSEYVGTVVFSENLVAVQLKRRKVVLNKPIYLGFTILEFAKEKMYKFHYIQLSPLREHFTFKLLFTDTDSLCYHIRGSNWYEQLANFQALFDFSNYPCEHPLFNTANKKVLGKMKDEVNGKPIREFVGLRAKMYSLDCVDHTKQTAKGVSRAVIRHRLNHAMYVETLRSETRYIEQMTRIRSEKHNLFTMTFSKVSLSAFDNKRYILADGVNTLAFGHKDINSF